jgi:hypothetical protein
MRTATFRPIPMAAPGRGWAPRLRGPAEMYLLQVGVRDDRGDPVQGQTVEVFYGDDWSETKDTLANGVAPFDFELHRGEARVRVSPPPGMEAYPADVQEVDLTHGARNIVNVNFTIRPPEGPGKPLLAGAITLGVLLLAGTMGGSR